jgi:glutathione synthase/RimK-type ligase-like ATP-grasp enzyme
MTLVHLLTGIDLPKPDPETHLVSAALAELGAEAAIVPWHGPGAGSHDADVVVIRSTWDYTPRREEFVSWCRATDEHTPILNPPAVIEWNSHKRYLHDLGEAGVPAVPTVVVPGGGQEAAVPGDWSSVVIKPAVSSGAMGAGMFAGDDPAALVHLNALAQEGDVLVQPFADSVATAGERSLIFLDGEYSHAVNKTPAAGDYRVQESRGGSVRVHAPTASEMEIAVAAIAVARADLLYARVDLIELGGRPHVIELELIEPELFLGSHPEAPSRLAEGILGRLPYHR